jgi:nicotinate-nucleotide adenylyltransferase
MCLFGGTFDPPHNAHFIIAEAIRESLDLNKIIFIPAYIPPHKQVASKISSIEHRLQMLKLCVSKNEHFDISTIEIDRGGISYTIDTIRAFKKLYNFSSKELHFLVGSDSLKYFKKWRDWEAILNEAQVIVARRPRFEKSDIDSDLIEKVIFLNLPRIEISSTEIRERALERQMMSFYLPEDVKDYIEKNNLYPQKSLHV